MFCINIFSRYIYLGTGAKFYIHPCRRVIADMRDLSTDLDKVLGVEIGRVLVVSSRRSTSSNELLEFIPRSANSFLLRNHRETGTPSISSSKHMALMSALIELSRLLRWVDSLLNGSSQSSEILSEALTLRRNRDDLAGLSPSMIPSQHARAFTASTEQKG